MFVDTQIGPKATRRQYQKGLEYLLVAGLAAVTVILFFVMGFFSQAAAATVADQLKSSQAAMLADRHILIGSTLLGVAVMAGSTFSLWRWQIRGLMLEAYHRVR